MAFRTFRDSRGIDWRVWDVHPQWTDRRLRERRSSDTPGTPSMRYVGPERRHLPGRRWGAPDAEPRVRVREGFEKGWLSCESSHERRRFAPIPESWEKLSDAQLELLCQRAQPAGARRSSRFIE